MKIHKHIVDIPFHKYLMIQIKRLASIINEPRFNPYPLLKRILYSNIIQKRKDKKRKKELDKTFKETIEVLEPFITSENKRIKEAEEKTSKENNDLNRLYEKSSKVEEESPFAEFDKEDYLKE